MSPEAPTMLLRRQTAFGQICSVVLDFEPKKVGYEAGLVLWWDMHSFASIGVTLTPDRRKSIIVKTPTDVPDGFKVSSLKISSWKNANPNVVGATCTRRRGAREVVNCG